MTEGERLFHVEGGGWEVDDGEGREGGSVPRRPLNFLPRSPDMFVCRVREGYGEFRVSCGIGLDRVGWSCM